MSNFPQLRLRRLRRTASLRRLFDTPLPGPEKFIWPVFVKEGQGVKEPIESMAGQFRMSVDVLLTELEPVVASGVGAIMIFGLPLPEQKDPVGSAACDADGVVQRAVEGVKVRFPDLVVCTDVCLCAYTSHGHCGPLNSAGDVQNDAANEWLAKVAVSHAGAGADVVAPSAMMDGQVSVIREALDGAGMSDMILMSYSSKFASSMYGPFRDAEQCSPQEGDRQSYQASYSNLRPALLESDLDEAEGADILMVKPALFYLDVITRLRDRTDLPIAAYNVSGEYAMLIAAAKSGYGDLHAMVRESTAALARAGTDVLISYWANKYKEIFGE